MSVRKQYILLAFDPLWRAVDFTCVNSTLYSIILHDRPFYTVHLVIYQWPVQNNKRYLVYIFLVAVCVYNVVML